MKREVEWAPLALDDLARIARNDQRQADRIRSAVERFAETSHGDTLKLIGRDALYRLRAWNWPVIFTYRDRGLVILTLRVLRRNEATYE